MAPKLKRCCCFTLRKGCILIAFFYGAKAVFTVSLASFSAYKGHNNARKADTEEFRSLSIAVEVTSIIMAIFNGAELIFNVLLLKGIIDSKPKYMFPWMVLCITDIIFSTFLFISAIVTAVLFDSGSGFIWSLFAEPANIVLDIYFHLVVQSYYKQLKCTAPKTPETTAPGGPSSASSVAKPQPSQPLTAQLSEYPLQVRTLSPIHYLPHKRLAKVGDAPVTEHFGSMVSWIEPDT